ncbi:MAG: aldehyde dehydrogenase family protein [Muricomes sp.]
MDEKIWLKKLRRSGFLSYMTEDNMEETMALRELVWNEINNKRWFAPSTREDFENALKDGFALVCTVDGQIIASLQCLLKNTDYSHDRYDSKEMQLKCADYSDTFVHPDYRGNGLQNIMEEKMEELCRKAGKTILLGTVDSDNYYSYHNFLKMGYHEAARLIKYGGFERVLMEKKLNESGLRLCQEERAMNMIEVFDESTGNVVGKVPCYDGKEIADMVDTAFASQPRWEKVPLFERGQILYKFCALMEEHSDEVAAVMANEMGKHISQAKEEIINAAEVGRANIEVGKHLYGQVLCDNSAGYENHLIFVRREALGVIAGIIPFNYPVDLTIQKMVPALLMGNAFICKASSNAPCCVKMVIDLAHEAGIPKEVLHFMTSGRDDCTENLLMNKKVACIAMTGGNQAGTEMMRAAAPTIKKVVLELGGNDPFIITEEAARDPELVVTAVEALAWGRILENNGQVCAAPKRVIVHKSVKDIFVKCLITFIGGLKQGSVTDPDVQLTRLVSEKAAKTVEQQIQHTVEQGAKIICGGGRRGCVVDVTVLDDVTRDMDIAKDLEIFGPVIPILTFDTDEEAIEIANQTKYGLSASVITKDLKKAFYFTENIKASAVYVNGSSALRHNDQPFGGYKSTGIGNEGAGYSCAEFSQLKTYGLCDVSPTQSLCEADVNDSSDMSKRAAEIKKLAEEMIGK